MSPGGTLWAGSPSKLKNPCTGGFAGCHVAGCWLVQVSFLRRPPLGDVRPSFVYSILISDLVDDGSSELVVVCPEIGEHPAAGDCGLAPILHSTGTLAS